MALGALLFLAPRLWRIEAVGEGLDEEASVSATRAMAEGKFSYARMNDFRWDAYQSKFCPVSEAVAVPFLWALGDRALAFRLPWALASLLLGFVLVRAAGPSPAVIARGAITSARAGAARESRRFGTPGALLLFTLLVFDFKNVEFSQWHRYVILEQLLSAVFLLLALRAVESRRLRDGLAAAAVGIPLLHTHLLAVFVLFGMTSAIAVTAMGERPRRFPRHLLPLAVLLGYAAFMLVLFRRAAVPGFFAPMTIGSAVSRSASYLVRLLANLGPVTSCLGLGGAVLLARSREARDRVLGLACLVAIGVYPLTVLIVDAQPRYLLHLQPVLLLCAAAAGARLYERFRPRRPAALLALVLAALPSAALTAWYLTTGGGRDAEQEIHVELRRLLEVGDGVLYVDQFDDPFHRRPEGFVPLPRRIAGRVDVEPLDHVPGTAYVVAWSSSIPNAALFTPAFMARLEPIKTVTVPALLQDSSTLTLYKFRKFQRYVR